MPRGDGTGPDGKGPINGRCVGRYRSNSLRGRPVFLRRAQGILSRHTRRYRFMGRV